MRRGIPLFLIFTFFGSQSYSCEFEQSALLTPASSDVEAICKKSTSENIMFGGEPEPYRMASNIDPEERWKGIQEQEIEFNPDFKPPLEKYLKNFTGKAPSYSGEDKKKVREVLKSPVIDKMADMTAFGPGYYCDSGSSPGCKKAFVDVVKNMSVRNPNGYLPHPESWVEFFSDPRYSLAANRMASLIYDKALSIHSPGSPQSKSPGDFYSDLEASFGSLGLPHDVTEKMIWTFINVMTTQGASILQWHQGLLNPVQRPSMQAVALIVSAASYLDSVSRESGKMYSIPPTIQTHCDYGRPYHFWLAASLARELKADGFNDRDTLFAVHSNQSMYEKFGRYAGSSTKKTAEEITEGDLHKAYTVETQKNIIYNDYGALWGIQSLPGKKEPQLNLDSSVIKAYNAAMPADTSIKKKVETSLFDIAITALGIPVDGNTFFQWDRVVDPDDSYKDLVKYLPN